jgi:hypothetical protein
MEGVLEVLGFGVGASIGMTVIRAATGGLRPALREVIKAGLTVTDAAQALVSHTSARVTTAASEAKETVTDLHEEAKAERAAAPRRARADAKPRKIEIAKE